MGPLSRTKKKQKEEIRRIQAKLKGELTAYKGVEQRMHYFNGIKNLARTLAAEASKLLDNAKTLKVAIDRVLMNLKQDYSEEEIEMNFGDGDREWIDDYA